MFYSSYSYLHDRLADRYACEVVPGRDRGERLDRGARHRGVAPRGRPHRAARHAAGARARPAARRDRRRRDHEAGPDLRRRGRGAAPGRPARRRAVRRARQHRRRAGRARSPRSTPPRCRTSPWSSCPGPTAGPTTPTRAASLPEAGGRGRAGPVADDGPGPPPRRRSRPRTRPLGHARGRRRAGRGRPRRRLRPVRRAGPAAPGPDAARHRQHRRGRPGARRVPPGRRGRAGRDRLRRRRRGLRDGGGRVRGGRRVPRRGRRGAARASPPRRPWPPGPAPRSGADYAVLSLSDRLKPWDLVERRLRAAAEADLVLALYNPASRSRDWQVGAARDVLLEVRGPETVVVVGRDVGRAEESLIVTTLGELDPATRRHEDPADHRQQRDPGDRLGRGLDPAQHGLTPLGQTCARSPRR